MYVYIKIYIDAIQWGCGKAKCNGNYHMRLVHHSFCMVFARFCQVWSWILSSENPPGLDGANRSTPVVTWMEECITNFGWLKAYYK